jgi:selenide,water dikinase
LPGYIAGRYRFEEFHIDLAALCSRGGVSFIEGAATGIDPGQRQVFLSNGRTLTYHLLSLDIGSTPSLPPGVSGGVSVKPIASFTERLARLDTLAAGHQGPLHLAVVGQGVAGVEVAFALKQRLLGKGVQIALVGRANSPVPARSNRAQRMVESELQRAGIAHYPGFDVVAFDDGTLVARDGRRLHIDEAVWTTSSGAPSWLRETSLDLDRAGFIRVDETLCSLSHPDIFAAGDVASLPDPRPKAGVFAVRQGPVLAQNIRRRLVREPLLPFRPQCAWLALISLSDGRAIADKWGVAVCGRWVSAWKHRNDTRFVRRYT